MRRHLEFVLTFRETFVGKLVIAHWQWLTMLSGFILVYLALRPTDSARLAPKPGLLRRWRLSRYTSLGLNWKVYGHSLVAEKAVALLRITSTGELPQPLEIVIRCAGQIADVGPGFYPDQTRPGERDHTSDIEVPSADDKKVVSFVLRSPKLHPPGYLDVRLRSVGNAEIRVLEVKRNPEGSWPPQ